MNERGYYGTRNTVRQSLVGDVGPSHYRQLEQRAIQEVGTHASGSFVGAEPPASPKGPRGGKYLAGLGVVAAVAGLALFARSERIEVEKIQKAEWRKAGLLKQMETWNARHGGLSPLSHKSRDHFGELLWERKPQQEREGLLKAAQRARRT